MKYKVTFYFSSDTLQVKSELTSELLDNLLRSVNDPYRFLDVPGFGSINMDNVLFFKYEEIS